MQISAETLKKLFYKLDISIPDFETQYAIWHGIQILNYGNRLPSYEECKNDLFTLLSELGIDYQDESTIKIIDDTLQSLRYQEYLQRRETLVDQIMQEIDGGSLRVTRCYFKEVILYFMEQQDQANEACYLPKMQNIYSMVASKFQSTPETVKRSIRRFIHLYYLSLSNKKIVHCALSSNEVLSTEKFLCEFSNKLKEILEQNDFVTIAQQENLLPNTDTSLNQREILFQTFMYELKIPSYSCNYRYLQTCLTSILILLKHNVYDDILVTKDVYPIVARSLGVSIASIEIGIRQEIRRIESKVEFLQGDIINYLYPNKDEHYTNSQFLNFLAQYIKKVEASEVTRTSDTISSPKKAPQTTSSLQSDTRTIIASYIAAQYGLEELLIYVMKGFCLPDDQIGFQYLKEILMYFFDETSAKMTLSSFYASLSLKHHISESFIKRELKLFIQIGRQTYLNTAKKTAAMDYMYHDKIKLSTSLFVKKVLRYVRNILAHQTEIISMNTNALPYNETLTFNKKTKTKK